MSDAAEPAPGPHTPTFTRRRLILLQAAALAGVACGLPRANPSSNTGTRGPGRGAFQRQATAEVDRSVARIGALLSLSGALANAGQVQANALRLAVDEHNAARLPQAAKLKLIVEDDQSDRPRAAELAQKLFVDDRIVALVGPTSPAIANATGPIAQQVGVPSLYMANASNGLSEIGDFIFRVNLTDAQIIPYTVAAVQRVEPIRRAALLYTDSAGVGRSSSEAFRTALEAHAVEVVAEESVARDERDFLPFIARLQASIADTVCASVTGIHATSLLQQMQATGLNRLRVVGGAGFNAPSVVRNAGSAADGVIVGAGWSPRVARPQSQAFVSRYRDTYGAEPDVLAAQAYAGVQLLAEALRRLDEAPERRALRDALAELQGVDTVLGPFSFDGGGNAAFPPVVQVIRGGQYHLYG